jgi:hypothetical protein
MAISAITVMREEASTTRNKWLTLEAWRTILYHYYDLHDQLGFSLNTLTRAVKLLGAAVDSKVCGGNSTGVHIFACILSSSSTARMERNQEQIEHIQL